MTKKYRIPKYKQSEFNVVSTVPLVVQEGPKFPWEFIELKQANIPKAKSQKFSNFYKEKRVYKPKPVYEDFTEFPEELKRVFLLAVDIFEKSEPDWITLKRFLNDRSPPKSRWLWGFSLRDRGTEKIKINQNDLLVLYEWKKITSKVATIPIEKLFDEDKGYINRLSGIIKASDLYSNGKSIEWIKKLYLKELEKEKKDEQ